MKMKKQPKNSKNNVKRIFNFTLLILAISLAVLVISIYSTEFAEWYSNCVSSVIRQILSFVSGVFPFSVAEIILYAVPLIIVLIILNVVRKVRSKNFVLSHFLYRLLSVIMLLVILFINTFAVCYLRQPLEKNLNLHRRSIDRDEAYESALFLKRQLDNVVDSIEFDDSGASVNPHSWSSMDNLIDAGYDKLSSAYDFITRIHSKPKQILISPLMTYTHISGIYMPFTGEANVNTNYPDYVVAFTMAHEKAHQRGIASEDEANFVAFLALLASDDEYLNYCALMTMYDYFLDSLIVNDFEMYNHLLSSTDYRIIGEMRAYSKFFDKYRDSGTSKIADAVNDTYLKTMGEDKGVESYGMVVELFFAYIEKNNGLPY